MQPESGPLMSSFPPVHTVLMSEAFTPTVSAHHSLICFIIVVLTALISMKSSYAVTVTVTHPTELQKIVATVCL